MQSFVMCVELENDGSIRLTVTNRDRIEVEGVDVTLYERNGCQGVGGLAFSGAAPTLCNKWPCMER